MGGGTGKGNVNIGQIISSGNNELMIDGATYYTEDDMIEVRLAYNTGSLTTPTQLNAKAKNTDNTNKKYLVKNVKVSPTYYVIFIPKIKSKHFSVSLNVYSSPIEKSTGNSTNLMATTTFDTIKLTDKNVKTAKKFDKKKFI